jgi:hypothetical protein
MKDQARAAKIASYGAAYDTLVAALADFPQEMWQFRPSPDQWTIHEIIVHITDSEANSYVRCRRLLAEPGGTVLGYDEGGWAKRLHYHQQSTDDALALFKWLRHASYRLIVDAPASVWSHTVHHTEDGMISMEDWLNTYERHVPDHIEQMQAVYNEWAKANPNRSTQ